MDATWTSDGDDPGLLDELLSFLDAPAPAPAPQPTGRRHEDDDTSADSRSDCSQSSPRVKVAVVPVRSSAVMPRGRSQIKRTLDQLRAEAQQLTHELERLRQASKLADGSMAEIALQERVKRRRAEKECKQLRDAVYAQTRFLRGLRGMFAAPAWGSSSLNLCHLLHIHTRLPRDRSSRWSEYAALAEEARLRSAMEILSNETQINRSSDGFESPLPSVTDPHIQTELLRSCGGFGVSTVGVYAVDTNDIGAVLRAVCVAVRDIVVTCQSYMCMGVEKKIVDADATLPSPGSSILYRILGVHHKSKSHDDELSVESRVVTLYKQMDDHAIVLWDYVDDDELNPISSSTDITRQAVGGCLIRREVCDDGVQRVVCRTLHTRRYQFNSHSPRDVLQRFQISAESTAAGNELVFRKILLSEVQREQADYLQALGALQQPCY